MNDQQLLRYSRHILLDEIDVTGQQRLLDATVLIVGAGGLGAPALMYLAAAGIGHLVIADDDQVDLTNLQRQIVHRQHSIGQLKVDSARETLLQLNPESRIETVAARIDRNWLDQHLPDISVVLDCSDNFATRHLVNAACVAHKRPLVSGAAIRFDGQLSVFDARQDDSPCYACLFPEQAHPEEISCASMGVLAPLTGIIGSMQAVETIKLLTGCGQPATGRLIMVNALSMEIDTLQFQRQRHCPVCGNQAATAL